MNNKEKYFLTLPFVAIINFLRTFEPLTSGIKINTDWNDC
jgi:hypothetical protein